MESVFNSKTLPSGFSRTTPKTVMKAGNSSNSLSSRVAKRKKSENGGNQMPTTRQVPSRIIKQLIADTSKEIGYKKSKKRLKITKPEVNLVCEKSDSVKVVLPHIDPTNWKKFEDKLLHKNVDKVTEKLNACIAKMKCGENLRMNTHFTGFRFVQEAIVDALLNRKWDDLLQLTVMLGRNYSDPVYRIFIRNLCQILKHYHPSIRGTEYEGQLDLIVDKYTPKNVTESESVSIV